MVPDVVAAPHRPAYTHTVATRWYRAPELLFGAREYGPAVDVWAAGCVVGELLALSPLFPGHTDILQLARVLQALGSGALLDEWPEAARLPDYGKVSFPPWRGGGLSPLLPHADSLALDLLGHMLTLNPARRASAAQVLRHEWFRAGPAPAGAHDIHQWLKREGLV